MEDEPTCEICYATLTRDEVVESMSEANFLCCFDCLDEDDGEEDYA